jgi:anthranilate phosphoribosyltransferase
MTLTFVEAFPHLSRPTPDPAVVEQAFGQILSGAWTPVQVAGFAVALRMRGESAEIIAAAARAMRRAMVPVDHGLPMTFDTCGTGGDGLHTINVSTAAAIVVAAAGVPVAKHGNRAASSRTGSADVLEALGIPLDLPPERQAAVLREAGIIFMFAQAHHPALRHAGVARKELGIRTIFNVLGPLSNPARATHQLLGTYDDALRPLMAATLAALGTKRAWVLRGADGLDEVSPTGVTYVTELDAGNIRERTVLPSDFGLPTSPLEALRGGDVHTNAAAVEAILANEPHPARTAVVLNAAAALVVAKSLPLKDAADEANHLLASGRARDKLLQWKQVAQAMRVPA